MDGEVKHYLDEDKKLVRVCNILSESIIIMSSHTTVPVPVYNCTIVGLKFTLAFVEPCSAISIFLLRHTHLLKRANLPPSQPHLHFSFKPEHSALFGLVTFSRVHKAAIWYNISNIAEAAVLCRARVFRLN
jgi:hypothetical protein